MTDNLDHFRRAAQALVGPGTVKQRLCEAYVMHLRLVDDQNELSQAMHMAAAAGGLSAAEATVRKMSEQDAGGLAARVLEMLIAVSRDEARESAAQPPRQFRLVVDDDEVPAFLNRA